MNSVYKIEGTKKRKADEDLNCFLCSSDPIHSEKPVAAPQDVSYAKLVESINKRSEHGESKYRKIVSTFNGNFSVESVKSRNLKWHRSCYQNATNKTLLNRLKEDKKIIVPNEPETPEENKKEDVEVILPKYTRSQSTSYDKKNCFFCDRPGLKDRPLFRVASDEAGKKLRRAVEFLQNDELRVRLSEALNLEDAHAIDVLYHGDCWTAKVTNVLRSADSFAKKVNSKENESDSSIAAGVEFLSVLEAGLEAGNIYSMDILEKNYLDICQSNEVPEHAVMTRRDLKKFIEIELAGKGVEFSRPTILKLCERVSMKHTRGKVLFEAENSGDIRTKEMQALFKAAAILRKLALGMDLWTFDGSIPSDTSKIVPENMKIFFKWIINGTKDIMEERVSKIEDVERRACSISQILLFNCLSRRQVGNRQSLRFKKTRECPLQVASGLTVHHLTRNKQLTSFLNSIGCSINYFQILRIETRIAKNVLRQIKENDGIYVPPDIVPGRFVHFAMDNIDFSEDTVDGRKTFHGTVMTVYQIIEKYDSAMPVCLTASNDPSDESFDDCLPKIIHCSKPCNWTSSFPASFNDHTVENSYHPEKSKALRDFYSWVLLRKAILGDTGILNSSPTWAGFHSLIRTAGNESKVCLLPIIPESPTGLSVQFTAMHYLDKLKNVVNPTQSKTVITADMALYKPMKQLEMARADLQGKWIFKPGELHIIIAQLRTIGEFIRGSGLPEIWIECDLYSPVTVKNILDGRHIRRGINAHVTTVCALNILLFEEYDKEISGDKPSDLKDRLEKLAKAIKNGEKDEIMKSHEDVAALMENNQLPEKLQQFIISRSEVEPLFKMASTYLEMVQTMLFFLRAVRTADWNLGLTALHDFLKFFFSLNRLNYARMISLYLFEMDQLNSSNPEIWEHFMKGEWVVNRNSVVPFCSLGADETLEQKNRTLKVQGGLIGITQNDNARNRFFLVSPELSRIATETKGMLGLEEKSVKRHHELSVRIQNRQSSNVLKIKEELQNSTNPFQCKNSQLIHILSHRVFPQDVKDFVTNISEIGEKLEKDFNMNRIKNKTVPFWAPMKKTLAKTFASSSKKMKIKSRNDVITMSTNFSLISRLLIASRSRPDIDIKMNISNFEFSALPKALFGPDGKMYHCNAKSKLVGILESLVKDESNTEKSSQVPNEQLESGSKKAAILDGMAYLHTYFKPTHIKTCEDLCIDISKKILLKFGHYNEVHVVFDTYFSDSLKKDAREHRSQGKDPVQYRISAEMKVASISMTRLLAHEKTKDEMTAFLAEKILKMTSEAKKKFIVSWRDKAQSSEDLADVSSLCTTQEEADTKIILHAVYLASNGLDVTHIFSPDTDVMVLALRRIPRLTPQVGIFLGQGMKKFVDLIPIFNALGPLKASALPGLHALSGADITGSFINKGKLKWWKTFINAGDDIHEALAKLGTGSSLDEEIRQRLEELVCKLYIPKTALKDVGEVRWWLFTKKQCQDENLPPTRGALDPAFLRAHLQASIWRQDLKQNPELPPALDCGWKKTGENFEPIPCVGPCVPEVAMELCRCNCGQKRCAPPCTCRTHNLKCTEMCKCEGKLDLCDNFDIEDEDDDDEERTMCSDTSDSSDDGEE